jgi:redox-sensitive bicupin YhaK (pirin superfamily)
LPGSAPVWYTDDMQVIDQRRRDLGGFEVGRVLPYTRRHMVGPFIFFDHIGPKHFSPGFPKSVDVRPHPHIGLATVTYLFAGEIMHRDSVGAQQAIQPDEVNWMIAGRGITHSERFEKARAHGGPLHGIQAWVALPVEHEETEPSFAHYGADALPLHEDSGVRMRVLAGEIDGLHSDVKTHSPLFYAHLEVERGSRHAITATVAERALYVAAGEVQVQGQTFGAGRMLVFDANEDTSFEATSRSTLMALGGESVGERFIEWNFVSSSIDRIEQAKADWRAQRMKLPDFDNQEYIPLA